ncbi:hypothetical protein [Larkinella soli]|uniref:hypothetical protein n=1 Tax=Larkinella soli TaxID=1770527 RepID=UPI000FFB0873|nr:hypothetical protein [Larkinella soli]
MNRSDDHVTHTTTLRMLSWREALAILERCDAKGGARPFSITFCTANPEKKTGGEIIHYDKAIWHVRGGRVKPRAKEAVTAETKGSSTGRWSRRIRAVDSDQIRRVHVHLILEINGQPIK